MTIGAQQVARVTIDARGLHYRELNARIREALAGGETEIALTNVNGQRYIADGIEGPAHIEIEGVPGNDLGAFMDGPTVVVHGNAQDAIGNTMNAGKIVVHGNAGDVLGYGMRGGKMLVRGDVGYRVGIHMKAYRSQVPVLVVGGGAADFLGEYMAGGMLVVLGLDGRSGDSLVGDYCATGMHGGIIYLRGEVDPSRVATNHVTIRQASEDDLQQLRLHLEEFCAEFGLDVEEIAGRPFAKLVPFSHRPYGGKYAA
jgi:glutamate synthase domain-containing protein 3